MFFAQRHLKSRLASLNGALAHLQASSKDGIMRLFPALLVEFLNDVVAALLELFTNSLLGSLHHLRAVGSKGYLYLFKSVGKLALNFSNNYSLAQLLSNHAAATH